MIKKLLLPVFLFAVTAICNAQVPSPETGLVKWMKLEEAMHKNATVQKPILLDFYTDWCGWCKHMMKTTYSDPSLAEYINNYFYPVKFNAEGKDTIEYLGKVYKPTSDQPKAPHEFAIAMLQGKLSYPTTIFINGFDAAKNEFRLNMIAAGYLDRQKIEPMLVFTVENAFRNSTFDDFNVNFEKAFRDSTLSEKINNITWKHPSSVFTANAKSANKKLIFINTDWCNTCRVMKRTSFLDDAFKTYVDSTFTIVDFNPELKDSLRLNGNVFVNPSQPQMPFHQLALALCKNNLVLPTIALLDEDNNLIDAIPFYLPPSILQKILFYYGEDIHKTKSWQEYMSSQGSK